MSVKISELPILDSLADNDILAGVDSSANVTSKIELGTLKNYIDTNTQYTAGTNIDITNNVISAPDVPTKEEFDSLSTIFNAFPTESGEGEILTLDGTAEVKFKKFDLEGNTSQTTYSGKNLFGVSDTTGSASGVTLTVTNGEILVTGTSSNSGQIDIPIEDISLSTTQAYSVKLIDSGTATGSYGRYFLDSSSSLIGWSYGQSGLSDHTNFNPNSNTTAKYFRIYWNSGASFSNFKFKIMFEKGSTSSSYEPYVGGTASPSPDYPQDVHVVSGDNEIVVSGKNLFNNVIDDATVKVRCSLSYENGEIVMSTTGSDAYFGNVVNIGNSWNSSVGKLINVEPNTSYYFTVTNNLIAKNFITFYDKDLVSLGATYLNSYSKLITSPSNAKYCNLRIGYNDSVSGGVYKLNVQFEKSDQATTFEPYIGNTYNIDLPVENLFDKDISIVNGSYINGSGGITSDSQLSYQDEFIEVEQNTDYTISSNETTIYRIAKYDSSKTFINRLYNENPSTSYTINTGNAKYIKMAGTLTTALDSLQIEKGSKANSYTPYDTPPIICHGIGDNRDYFYKNKQDGYWYLYTTIGKYTLNGINHTFNYKHGSIKSDTKGFYQFTLYDKKRGGSSGNTSWGLSNYFKFVSGNANTAFTDNTSGIWWESNTDYAYCILEKTSLTDANNWLKTHITDVYFVMEHPYSVQILPSVYPELVEQLDALQLAMSKQGQTNILQVNNENPFIIDAEAIIDLSSLVDRVTLLES